LTVYKVFSGFLRTHQYAAFSSNGAEDGRVPVYEKDTSTGQKRKQQQAALAPPSNNKDGPGVQGISDDADMDIDTTVPTVRLWRAKAMPDDVHMWGGASEIPNNSGLFFPFEEVLANSDVTSVPSVIERYFLKCLGSTTRGQFDTLSGIRTAWKDSVANTRQGHWLAHVAKVIDLALRGQACVFLIIDENQYVGAVLSGAAFSIGYQGESVQPISFTELQVEVRSFSGHDQALEAILVAAGVTDAHEAAEGIYSVRTLKLELEKRSLDDEARQTITKLTPRLAFGETFWPVNADTIKKAYTRIIEGTALNYGDPMHISQLFNVSPIADVLSVFGFTVPSFSIPGGKTILIDATGESSPHLESLHVAMKPIEFAVADTKAILEKRTFLNLPGELSKNSKFRCFKGAEMSGLIAVIAGVKLVKAAPVANRPQEKVVVESDVLNSAFD